MLVKKSDTAVQQIEIELDAINPLDYPSSKETLKIWALPIEIAYLPSQVTYSPTDNRLKNRIFFKWAGAGRYVYTAMDKREIKSFSGISVSAFSEPGKSIRFAPIKDADSWFENYTELKSVSRLKVNTSETVAQLKEFALLEENWDSYGAKQIKWSTIIKAIDFFNKVIYKNPNAPVPFVAPVPDGSIHFAWEVCSKSLMHFIPEGKDVLFSYIKIDKTSGEIRETKGSAISSFEMADIVSDWMKDVNVMEEINA